MVRILVVFSVVGMIWSAAGCGGEPSQPLPSESSPHGGVDVSQPAATDAQAGQTDRGDLQTQEGSDLIPVATQEAASPDPAPDQPPQPRPAGAAATFEQLVQAHRDQDPDAWEEADAALIALGERAVPALVEGLNNPDRDTRELAAMVLARVGPETDGAADALLEVLDDDSVLVRVNAASTLSVMSGPTEQGERTGRIVSTLFDLLDETDVNVRMSAIFSLGNLGPHAEPAVPRLIAILGEPDAGLRSAAATTLGRIGPAAEPAVPTLEALRDHDDPETQSVAGKALEQIQSGDESAPEE